MTTQVHEAAHAACLWLRRPVEYVAVHPGSGFPGEEVGHCHAPVPRDEGIQARDLGVALIGYMAEAASGWPPSYEDARSEKREALALLIDLLGVNEEQYEQLIEVTRGLLADPDFQRLRDSIARALHHVPRLESEDIEALCRATGTPVQQLVGAN